MAFLTIAGNLVLIEWIVRRLTHSRLAALTAAICWIANPAMATVMSWSAAYNEALCPFCLLLALALFIRFAETGARRFWWWQLVVFSLAFGVLEINVVYPALAAAWVLLIAPRESRARLLLSLVPLFLLSVVYFFIHNYFAPLPTTGVYAVYLDTRMVRSLRTYFRWSLLPPGWQDFGHSHTAGRILYTVELLGLAALFIAEVRRRRWTALFFPAWFLITLAPVLPIPSHLEDYYLTIPLIGLGMLAGYAVSSTAAAAVHWRICAAIPILAYLILCLPVARSATAWQRLKSLDVRALVLGVEAAHEAHPSQSIVLSGINRELFDNAVGQSAFFPLGLDNVYLAPDAAATIGGDAGMAVLDNLVLDPATLQHALTSRTVVLYSVAGDHLRNITEQYERSAPNRLIERLPLRVVVGNPLFSWLLGKEWLPIERGVRWMPGDASLRLGGPERTGSKLRIEGYCPDELLKRSSRHLIVTVDGEQIGQSEINDPESAFVRLFDLPPAVVGRNSILIGIRVTPVERRGGQDYGLVFGGIAIQP